MKKKYKFNTNIIFPKELKRQDANHFELEIQWISRNQIQIDVYQPCSECRTLTLHRWDRATIRHDFKWDFGQ